MSFNLTTDPWLPCRTFEDSFVELSTHDVLTRAHEIRALATSCPLETIAVHRHLLAILHRAYGGPEDMQAWAKIYTAGQFDSSLVGNYLASVRDRMDLFHPEKPFAQVPGLSKQFNVDPIDMLTVKRRSWGTARELFQHRPSEHRASMRPGEAACALLAYHAFDIGGLVKKPGEPTAATSAPLVGGAAVLVQGESLFETLVLNLLQYNPSQSMPIPGDKDDKPAWEASPPPHALKQEKEPKRMPKGWLDLLTWWSRRIELVHEGEHVTGFVRCVGSGLSDTCPREPMFAWQKNEEKGWRAVSLSTDRVFWRDAHALLGAIDIAAASHQERPKAIEQLCTEEAFSVVPLERMFTLEVVGITNDKSRVDMVRCERLRSTAPLLANIDASEAIRDVMTFASEAITSLGKAIYIYGKVGFMLPENPSREQSEDLRAFIRSLGASPAAWSELSIAFASFLQGIADNQLLMDDRLLIAQDGFEKSCLQTIRQLFEEVTEAAEQSSGWLKARVRAEQKLNYHLGQIQRVRLDEPEVA